MLVIATRAYAAAFSSRIRVHSLLAVMPEGYGRPTGQLLERGQIAVEFELGDLAAVLPPLLALVAQEEVEHVLAERLGDELAGLHHVARVGQALRQRCDAERPAL